jgi:predicted DCC family thiol-disulfide oxidoreductase YuxK
MDETRLEKPVVLFDGVCNLCNGSVQFILKHDPKGYFKFAALQSTAGAEILKYFNLSTTDFDTFVFVERGKPYLRSSAALRVARGLSGLWPLLYAFVIIPAPLRDLGYRWVARNRYRWFGKRDTCMIPSPELKARFLD